MNKHTISSNLSKMFFGCLPRLYERNAEEAGEAILVPEAAELLVWTELGEAGVAEETLSFNFLDYSPVLLSSINMLLPLHASSAE
jgi:hypothetical protein